MGRKVRLSSSVKAIERVRMGKEIPGILRQLNQTYLAALSDNELGTIDMGPNRYKFVTSYPSTDKNIKTAAQNCYALISLLRGQFDFLDDQTTWRVTGYAYDTSGKSYERAFGFQAPHLDYTDKGEYSLLTTLGEPFGSTAFYIGDSILDYKEKTDFEDALKNHVLDNSGEGKDFERYIAEAGIWHLMKNPSQEILETSFPDPTQRITCLSDEFQDGDCIDSTIHSFELNPYYRTPAPPDKVRILVRFNFHPESTGYQWAREQFSS